MHIRLDEKELKRILVEKFGESDFTISYAESDKIWELRTGEKIKDQQKAPEKIHTILHL